MCVPAIAMRITDEVNWGPEDFVVMGAMLAALCFGLELAMRMSKRASYRFAAALALGGGFCMTWVNLAVGIVGEPGNPANLMFALVLLLALLGAAIARLRPAGMARAMAATAMLQGVVVLCAAWLRSLEGVVVSAAFVPLWLLAALLFRHAARSQPTA